MAEACLASKFVAICTLIQKRFRHRKRCVVKYNALLAISYLMPKINTKGDKMDNSLSQHALMAIIGIGAYFVVMGFFGVYVADKKGRGATEGFLFSVLLGPLGLIILGLLPNIQKPVESQADISPKIEHFSKRMR